MIRARVALHLRSAAGEAAMGFYADHVFPRVMEWTMGTRRFQEQRELALAPLHGEVLEIGFGTGLNLPHYPRAVSWLTALEPANPLPHKVVQRLVAASLPVQLARLNAESLPYDDGRFDCVLSTWTLCTIADVLAALREIRRVLKPDGKFVFLEHGRSDDPRVAKWQDVFTPFQRFIACGCHLNRPIDGLITQAGLTVVRLDRFVLAGVPRIAGEMYRGVAAPNGS